MKEQLFETPSVRYATLLKFSTLIKVQDLPIKMETVIKIDD
jgi:hypothetical protein